MESELSGIDEQLVKLEAEVAEATGVAKQRLERALERLRKARRSIAAEGDTLLASGQDSALQDDLEVAISELDMDMP